MKAQYIPALLEQDINVLEKKVNKLLTGQVIHLDIMDSTYTPSLKTVELAEALEVLKKFRVQIHLMVNRAQVYISQLTKNVELCILHQDTYSNMAEFSQAVSEFKSAGVSIAATINPNSNLQLTDKVGEYQIMGVFPGKSGQMMLENTKLRVVKLKQNLSKNGMIISVDGGVNQVNSKQLIEAGATKLIINSALWKSPDAQEMLNRLNKG